MASVFVETAPGRGCFCRKAAVGLFAVGFAITLAGCNRPAAPAADQRQNIEPATSTPTPPEMVEVWVAARDLPVGTVISRSDLETLAVKKKIQKNALPPAYVSSEEELFDKRLMRGVNQDASFDPAALGKNVALTLPPGLDLVAISLPAESLAATTVIPGTKVDVIASMKVGANTHDFALLVDVLVVAVDTYLTGPATQLSVSVAATQEQALLLALARQRECKLDLARRDPKEPTKSPYDIRKVRRFLQNNAGLPTEMNPEVNRLKAETEPAPAPRELVEVWVAVGDIPPNTEFSRELLEKSLRKLALSKAKATGAYSDLTDLIEQRLTLKDGLRDGVWITASVIGPPRVAEPVAHQELEVAPMPRPVMPKKFKDVTITTSTGTMIHRYEEVAPGKFVYLGQLTPEQAGLAPKKSNSATPTKR